MLIKKGTVILVADGAKAILYRNDGGVDNVSLSALWHAQTENLASRQLGTDTPGRTQASAGTGRSSYAETDLHQAGEDGFAKDTAEKLEKGIGQEPGSDIIVVAAPSVLGILRNHYGSSTREKIVVEIDKDLTNMPKEKVAEFLSAYGEN